MVSILDILSGAVPLMVDVRQTGGSPLVRDKGVESHDSPPSTNYEGELTPIEDDDEESGDDLVGSDSPEAPSDPYQGVRFGPDFFGQARPQ
jgi:hypothetical protein